MSGNQFPESPDSPENRRPSSPPREIRPLHQFPREPNADSGENPSDQGLSFGYRLLLLPVWFVIATFPTLRLAKILEGSPDAHSTVARIGSPMLPLAELPICILLYLWLAYPKHLNGRQLFLRALFFVPLLMGIYFIFILAMVFAYCNLSHGEAAWLSDHSFNSSQ